jgi:membrane protease YdiL (CAAX protease family)
MTFIWATPSAALISGVTGYTMDAMGVYNKLWHRHLNGSFGVDYLNMIIVAPIAETLILSVFLYFASKFTAHRLSMAAVSGLVFGALHGINGIYWFFGPTWLFFIFSYSYLTWRTHSYGYAFLAACVPHMLNNLVSLLLINI